ncbi:MAG: hypothetical protein LAO31_20535 [Acidobacteriia bacterium]|nr:hypothetical protein [Terriglobia bacterium]
MHLWLVGYHGQFIPEQSIHHRIERTHDNPHHLAFRLEPFGEFVITPPRRLLYRRQTRRSGAQYLLEPRSKLTPYNMPVV